MNSFRGVHTMKIVTRVLLLEELRKIKPELIFKVAPEFIIVYEELDDEGNNVLEVNWEYALFKATLFQLEKLFSNFVAVKKPIITNT